MSLSAIMAVNHRPEVAALDQKFLAATRSNAPFTERVHLLVQDPSGALEVTVEDSGSNSRSMPSVDSIVAGMIANAERDVSRYPRSARAWISLGVELFNSGRFDEAETALLSAIEINPNNYVAIATLAKVSAALGDFSSAESLLKRLCERNPNDFGPRSALADLAAQQGDLDSSLSQWKEIVALRPQDARARVALGVAHLRLGKRHRSSAISHLRVATRIDPRSASAFHHLGVAYALSGNLRQARRAFGAALTLAPNRPDSVNGLAETLVQQGDAARAAEILTYYVSANPEDYRTRERLGVILWELSDYRGALGAFMEALTSIRHLNISDGSRRSRLLTNVGACYSMMGNLSAAEQFFRRAIDDEEPFDPLPFHNLARMYTRSGNLRQAESILSEGEHRFPQDELTKVMTAGVMSLRGKPEAALETLKESVDKGTAIVDTFVVLSMLYVDSKNDPDEAIMLLRKGLEEFPGNQRLDINLAYALVMNGDLESATKVLDRLGTPENVEAEVSIVATSGLLCLWAGNFDDGLSLYNHAEEIARQNGYPFLVNRVCLKKYLELARFHRRNGDVSAALSAIDQGLKYRGDAMYLADLYSLRESITAAR